MISNSDFLGVYDHRKMKTISKNYTEIQHPFSLPFFLVALLAYFLPEWCPASTYVREAKALGLEDVRQVTFILYYLFPFRG